MSKTLGQIAYEGFNTFKGNALCWPLANGHAVEEMAAWEAAANAIIEECAKIADNGMLVPPDGGSPTEDEIRVAENIAKSIRFLKTPVPNEGPESGS